MGTYIDSMHWDDVWMPAANEAAVLDAIAKKERKSKKNQFPSDFGRPKTVEELSDGGLHGISVERRGARIVFGEYSDREKLGDLGDLLQRMAPHMGGGEITMRAVGDDWRWVFRGGKLLSFDGRVVYYDELPDGYIQDEMWNGWFLPRGEPPDAVWFEVTR